MRREKETLIRAEARTLAQELWTCRGDLGKPIRNAGDLIPIDLEFVVTEILKLRLDEPEEISADTEGPSLNVETIERAGYTSVLSRKFVYKFDAIHAGFPT